MAKWTVRIGSFVVVMGCLFMLFTGTSLPGHLLFFYGLLGVVALKVYEKSCA